MRGQLDRRYVFGVIQATGNQRLIRVTLKEADQHLHADARNGDGAVTISGPAGRHTQPAAGVLVGLRFGFDSIGESMAFDGGWLDALVAEPPRELTRTDSSFCPA